jgi:hypothetical protein
MAGLVPATPIVRHGRATTIGVGGTSPAMTAARVETLPTTHYSAFQGMSLRSISWNSTAVISPRMPITMMPTNM